jgi:hypothetical protein
MTCNNDELFATHDIYISPQGLDNDLNNYFSPLN